MKSLIYIRQLTQIRIHFGQSPLSARSDLGIVFGNVRIPDATAQIVHLDQHAFQLFDNPSRIDLFTSDFVPVAAAAAVVTVVGQKAFDVCSMASQ